MRRGLLTVILVFIPNATVVAAATIQTFFMFKDLRVKN